MQALYGSALSATSADYAARPSLAVALVLGAGVPLPAHHKLRCVEDPHNVSACRRDPMKTARTEEAAAQREVRKTYHALHHKISEEQETLPAAAGQQQQRVESAPAAAATAAGDGAGPSAAAGTGTAEAGGEGAAQQLATAAAAAASAQDAHSCPICLDDTIARCTVTICGHRFCSDCIYSIAAPCGPCPICRRTLDRWAVSLQSSAVYCMLLCSALCVTGAAPWR
jgi:hypothetical protein